MCPSSATGSPDRSVCDDYGSCIRISRFSRDAERSADSPNALPFGSRLNNYDCRNFFASNAFCVRQRSYTSRPIFAKD